MLKHVKSRAPAALTAQIDDGDIMSAVETSRPFARSPDIGKTAAAVGRILGQSPVALTLIATLAGVALYLGHELSITLWAGLALALGLTAFILLRNAKDALAKGEQATVWHARIIGALWLAGSAWALLAWFDCPTCGPLTFPFLKATVLLIALVVLTISAKGLKLAAFHTFLPAVLAFAFVAFAARLPADMLTAVITAVVMLFMAYFNGILDQADSDLDQSRIEAEALARDLATSRTANAEALANAEQASRTKAAFLAAMSHDLRTPLNAIIGFSEIMKDGVMGPVGNPVYREYVSDIHKSGRHLLSMIDGVLDMSRLEAGNYRLEERNIRLSGIIDIAMTIAAIEASQRSISIRAEVEEGLVPVNADERALRQILLNLLSNAIKFSPKGSEILIRAGWSKNGGQFLSVKDQGDGMSEDELARVTEPFVRGKVAASTQGFGLGLSIVRELAEAHQASITLNSAPGAGTEAVLELPMERVAHLKLAMSAAATQTLDVPLSSELHMPFDPSSIALEASANADTRGAKARLNAALARLATRQPAEIAEPAGTADDTGLDLLLEEGIINALENHRETHAA
ncbi:HAMP domain-containing sensor histidine kinase [Martelella sp. HB161492]|uniref:sensor histidine kinase n=1 Tax=Martelella sp. HB161492 TaxID=2720726 RepID=UPI00159140DB|nr:HAMP domain-containing sensor histidine kinase [Martelella sp. HB161492]